jgi:tRNA A37 threonylcarbamoyladenosine modification protein TsaB
VLVLALDTSSPTVAVAVCDASADDVRVQSERAETAENRHGERLAPLIVAALRDARLGVDALEGIVVGLGPAPFTGPFAVLSDARRKQVYWALYDESGARIDGPELGLPVDVATALGGRTTDVAGAGALLYREVFAGFAVREGDPSPRAADLVWCADLAAPPGELAPLYLRRPDAQPPGKPKAVTPA